MDDDDDKLPDCPIPEILVPFYLKQIERLVESFKPLPKDCKMTYQRHSKLSEEE